ncbi:MAG: hypothetical protein RIF41_14090 [Polyangiaceae bacterium]
MGLLDKAKVWLGILDEEDLEGEDEPRAAMRINPRNKDGRPPLDDVPPPPQHSLEDALEARERGDLVEMRRLLEEMDRGRGLRTVLRAAAALEAEDEKTLGQLLSKVREVGPPWKLPLQLATSLDDPKRSRRMRRVAERRGAPKWALAWARICRDDGDERRRGLVDLLFADAALARTVAARELNVDGAEADTGATQRFAQFAHGRDCVKRFGPDLVADVYERAHGDTDEVLE